ncbi:hypothetical protein HHK36_023281 [Tetracentron sinense]|uniref:Uncharacterized protein n=1 Tax=Tetracentron sinense TaxID=13715 RepID=A0A834YSV4_TETSI|nr:hypothetical protein HHK36_023281 [Tetracentron sinense]
MEGSQSPGAGTSLERFVGFRGFDLNFENVESMLQLGLGSRESYPERPDCSYYMRTGLCGSDQKLKIGVDCPKGSTLYGFKGGPAGIRRADIGIYLSLQKSAIDHFAYWKLLYKLRLGQGLTSLVMACQLP